MSQIGVGILLRPLKKAFSTKYAFKVAIGCQLFWLKTLLNCKEMSLIHCPTHRCFMTTTRSLRTIKKCENVFWIPRFQSCIPFSKNQLKVLVSESKVIAWYLNHLVDHEPLLLDSLCFLKFVLKKAKAKARPHSEGIS